MNIIKHRYVYFLISLLVILPGLAAVIAWGFPLAIDFTGGSVLEVKFAPATARPASEEMITLYADHGVKDAQVQTSGDDSLIIRSLEIDEAKKEEIVAAMKTWQEFLDRLLQHFRIRPEIQAHIRVKNNRSAGLLHFFQRRKMRILYGCFDQIDRAKMQDICSGENKLIQFFLVQQHIRAGIAVETEFTLPIFLERHKRQRRVCLSGPKQVIGVHLILFEHISQIIPEGILAHFADEARVPAQTADRHRDIRGCASRLLRETGNLLQGYPDFTREKINQYFSNSINSPHNVSFRLQLFVPKNLNSRSDKGRKSRFLKYRFAAAFKRNAFCFRGWIYV